MQLDNWGWRARFGILVVGDDPVPEAEWWAMAPAGVSVHTARVEAGTPWATLTADGTVELTPDLQRGTEILGRMRLEAVVLAHSSSSFMGGPGWDAAVVARMSGLTNGIPVTTSCLDSLAALQALGVRRPFLVLPPWYSDAVVEAGLRYYAERGIQLAGHHRYRPGPGFDHLTPNEVWTQGGLWSQDPERLYRQVRTGCPASADAVLIVGTSFRTAAAIEPLERDLGRAVLTANQVSLWHCLRLAGSQATVKGYGRLFER